MSESDYLSVLDQILKEQVKDRFDHRNINLDVPEFADGKLVLEQ